MTSDVSPRAGDDADPSASEAGVLDDRSLLTPIALDSDEDRAGVFEDVVVERSSVAVSARWSLVGLVSMQLSRILFSALLARLLGPENFGIIGQATIYLAFASVFLDIGLASALIQRERISRDLVGTATSLNLIAVAILVLATQVGAGMWAAFFNTPELASVLRVLSLDFVLIGFAVVPSALLTRRLDFRKLAMAEVSSTLIAGVVGVAAALSGSNYWALVIQTLVRDLVFTAIVVKVVGRPFLAWTRNALRAIVGFSSRVFGSQTLSFVSQNADNTLVAWRLGATALANYALSYRVLMLPVQILGQTANRLVFPIFSRLNDDPEKQARYFLTATTSLALAVTVPMVMVALTAPVAVPFVFGSEWGDAVLPMQVLAIASILRAVVTVSGGVMLARGRADWAFRWAIVTTVFLLGGFAVGLHWGINGVAWSYLLVGLPLAMIQILIVRRLIPFTAFGYIRAVAPAVVGGLAMVGVWFVIDRLAAPHLGSFELLATYAVTTAGVFVLVVWLLWPNVFRTQIDFVRTMLKRGLPTPG